jgi:hypothetical protein
MLLPRTFQRLTIIQKFYAPKNVLDSGARPANPTYFRFLEQLALVNSVSAQLFSANEY